MFNCRNNKWIGTTEGIAKFDGVNWTIYDTSITGLPYPGASSIAIDHSGNKWFSSYGCIAKFDDVTWIIYDTSNSGLPSNSVGGITIDANGNKWIGGLGYGMVKFDDTSWTIYDPINSGIPDNCVSGIAIDKFNNKWIGTGKGFAIFNENGIIPIKTIKQPMTLTEFRIVFNQSSQIIHISFSIPNQNNITLSVFDTKGKTIKTLINDFKNKGEHKIDFNTNNISNGTYFINLRAGNNSITKKMVVLK